MSEELWRASTYSFGDGFCLKVLALCVRDPGFLQAHIDVVNPVYFERAQLGTIANLILNYFRKHFMVPTRESLTALVYEYARDYGGSNAAETHSTLASWIEVMYSMDLVDSPFVTENVVKFGQRQAFKEAIGKGLDMLEQREDDLSKFRTVFDDALRVGSTRQLGTDFTQIAMVLNELMQADPIYGIKNKVPTGIGVLDERLFGGIGAGEVCVIAGPPGRGKSTLMVNMAKQAARHFKLINSTKTVVYVTLEGGMKELDISIKFAGALTGILMNEIAMGSDAYRQEMQTQLKFLNEHAVRIKYFPPGSVGVEDLRWYIANLISMEQIEPGLLIIDYADKLKDMRDDRYVDAGRIYDTLTAIGDKFHFPVITGSQINREWAAADTIGGQGMAESWLKFANADVVVTLCQTPQEHEVGVMRLFLAKVRKGADMGTIYCHWRGDRSLVYEMTPTEVDAWKAAHPITEHPVSQARGRR